ncbi:hypothetical protein ACFY9F_12200 [Streptomyces sp. NPDC012421]|uniref:hypothetical protein n=1 Tax=Streptomyces sp. NPDC012421 TaxID=3364832 RepID=UPI0036E6423B
MRGLASALAWAVVWSVTVSMVVVPQPHRLLALGPPTSAPVLLGLTSSALYLGVASAVGSEVSPRRRSVWPRPALGPLGPAVTALAPL